VSGQEIAFILVGLGTAASAVLTVTSRNLVHAALFLAATLAGIGAVFLVLHADFVALVQIVVYVGAIAVLFLFGLMLTRAPIGREALDSQQRGLALGVAGAMFVVLTVLIVQAFGGTAASADLAGPTIATIGEAIFSTWVLPFELASMLLLAALVGAILLARRETGESGEEEATPTRIAIGAPPSTELEQAPSKELAETTGGGQ
jgi:NADH-quinone oxidoreductase subunit J